MEDEQAQGHKGKYIIEYKIFWPLEDLEGKELIDNANLNDPKYGFASPSARIKFIDKNSKTYGSDFGQDGQRAGFRQEWRGDHCLQSRQEDSRGSQLQTRRPYREVTPGALASRPQAAGTLLLAPRRVPWPTRTLTSAFRSTR